MLNSFKYILPFILLFIVGSISHGQVISDYNDISIFFGEKQKSKGNVEAFVKTSSGELLCIQNQVSLTNIFSRDNAKYTFSFITDYVLPETHDVTFYGNGDKSSLAHYTILGDNVLGISTQSSFMNPNPKLFYHLLNPMSHGKSNHGISLSDNFFFNTEVEISRLKLISSKDKKYASLIYIPKTLPEEFTNFKLLNFKDGSPNPQSENVIYPFPTKDYEVLDFYIQDENTHFVVSGHFLNVQTNNRLVIQDKYYQSITIGKISNEEFAFETIEDEGKFFTEVKLFQDDENIIISGLYTPFIDGNITGVFTAKINSEGKIIDKKYAPFSNDVISTIAGFNGVFLNDQYTIRNEHKGFDFLEFYAVEDGYVGIAEFNALEYRFGGNDVPGTTNTVDSYYWSNDLIVYKVNKDGELQWNKIVPKFQRSINDGGYFLSTAVYLGEEHLNLFFNDNLMNYDQNGVYNKNGDDSFATQFSAGKNTIGHVSLRLNDGLMNRKSTIGKEETDLLFIPLLSESFTNTKKLMIYGRSGNRHRVGSISFRN